MPFIRFTVPTEGKLPRQVAISPDGRMVKQSSSPEIVSEQATEAFATADGMPVCWWS